MSHGNASEYLHLDGKQGGKHLGWLGVGFPQVRQATEQPQPPGSARNPSKALSTHPSRIWGQRLGSLRLAGLQGV